MRANLRRIRTYPHLRRHPQAVTGQVLGRAEEHEGGGSAMSERHEYNVTYLLRSTHEYNVVIGEGSVENQFCDLAK